MLSVMRTAERLRAIELRAAEGRSVKEIAHLLGVAQLTVSLWVRDIELTEAQRRDLDRHARRCGRTSCRTERAACVCTRQRSCRASSARPRSTAASSGPSGSGDYLIRFVNRLTTVLPLIFTETDPVTVFPREPSGKTVTGSVSVRVNGKTVVKRFTKRIK